MSNLEPHFDSGVHGLGYRHRHSPVQPSVSKFRSKYMPPGMNVNPVVDSLSESESDMDTSDSDLGAQSSPQASPQDDKIPNGRRGGGSDVFDESSEVNSSSSNAKQLNKLYDEDDDVSSASPSKNNSKVSAEITPQLSFRNGLPGRYPTFHASELGHWHAVISYDACVRVCLNGWSRGCIEAPYFLEDECALLRDAFGLNHILLQSEEELLKRESANAVGEATFVKTKNTIGKIRVQVHKVKVGVDPPTGCLCTSSKSSSMVKKDSFQYQLSNAAVVSSERRALMKDHVTPSVTAKGSLLHQSMAYFVVATCRYLQEVPEKIRLNACCNRPSGNEVDQESYSCLLRLKSSPKEDAATMKPGSRETRIFLPDGLGDELIIEVHGLKGGYCGRAVVQVADMADESGEKLRQCSIYQEPGHKEVGKVKLNISYSTTSSENSHKSGCISETIAFDCVLETAMKVQQFQQRNLLLHSSWQWLVTEFALYFGVSDTYTKLRYISYVMDVATPTADCLDLVHELLKPVIIKSRTMRSLSHQEVRLLGEMSNQIEQMLILVFENYKSLDESLPSGMADVFGPATGVVAPALASALELYKLLHDILSPEVQSELCIYFQNAARKRCKRHLLETGEFVSRSNENILSDSGTVAQAYRKMKSACLNIRNEILCDIEIQKKNLLPSFIDLPNLSASIYSTELYRRLQAFLVSFPPDRPSSPIVELVVATADFQRDLSLWNISHIKGGVDAKELFHVYITIWIQEKRLALLELCKFDKGKSSSQPMQCMGIQFLNNMYSRLMDMLAEYDAIISRWPEYTFPLENAIAVVEKAVLERLEKEYADVLTPLKETNLPKKFGIKYVRKFTRPNPSEYIVSTELGVVLNSMRRMLDILRPQIETKVKSWGSCIPMAGNNMPGESLSEVAVMLRSKFRAYVQAVIDKLVENTKLHNITTLKKIIQSSKENVTMELDLHHRMHPLKELLVNTINQLHTVLETQVFITVCRGFWDAMGQDVLKFLEGKKENRSGFKASRIAITVLDNTFVSQMQQLLGNALQEKHMEPPHCMMEVRSMLGKDTAYEKGKSYYH